MVLEAVGAHTGLLQAAITVIIRGGQLFLAQTSIRYITQAALQQRICGVIPRYTRTGIDAVSLIRG